LKHLGLRWRRIAVEYRSFVTKGRSFASGLGISTAALSGELAFRLPSPKPLLPALALTACKLKVSGGELKVSRPEEPASNSYSLVARRPKMASSLSQWS